MHRAPHLVVPKPNEYLSHQAVQYFHLRASAKGRRGESNSPHPSIRSNLSLLPEGERTYTARSRTAAMPHPSDTINRDIDVQMPKSAAVRTIPLIGIHHPSESPCIPTVGIHGRKEFPCIPADGIHDPSEVPCIPISGIHRRAVRPYLPATGRDGLSQEIAHPPRIMRVLAEILSFR